MISVKGTFENGVALPLEPVKDSREGQNVIITFLDDDGNEISLEKANGTNSLEDLLAKCEVAVGISDLAQQHDHYLYGTPKK